MAYGCTIWNSSGVERLSLTDSTGKIGGIYSGTGSGSPQNISVDPEADADSAIDKWAIIDLSTAFPSGSMTVGKTSSGTKGYVTLTGYSGISYKFTLVRI